MKTRVTFLFCLLLSWATVSMAQTEIPVEFSSEDGIDTHWFYAGFNRRAGLVWTVDHDQSGEVQQKARLKDDQTQHWKFVGNQDGFYIVNRATGYRMAYTGTPITDSNGKPVPINQADGSVYYTDQAIAVADAAQLKFLWVSAQNGWAIINPALGSGTPYLNDRAGRNVCNYGSTDPGCVILFWDAEKLTIVPAVTSLYRDGLVNNTSKMSRLQVSSLNISGTITATISGDDAAAFGFDNGVNTVTNGEGYLYLTFTPGEARAYAATLTLSCPGAEDVTVALSGDGFVESDLPFIISPEDGSQEYWYYIQFRRKAADFLVWSLNDSTRMVVQDTLKGGIVRHDQQWKICGDWEWGYYMVNRETQQEIVYNTKDIAGADGDRRIFTDVPPDGTEGADRYVLPDPGMFGDNFEFTRFNKGTTWQMANRTASYYNNPNRSYINDQGGRHLCNYTINDGGCELVFIPIETAYILVPNAPLRIEAPVGETVSTTLNVGGVINSMADIAVSITGDGVFAVEPAVLPATGGPLTITFSPASGTTQYLASLTLKTEDAPDVVVSVMGIPKIVLPEFSTNENDYWYYVQFTRRLGNNLAWQGNGMDAVISQSALTIGKEEQQWKFVDAGDDGIFVENRKGGLLGFNTYYDEDDERDWPDGNARLLEEGIGLVFAGLTLNPELGWKEMCDEGDNGWFLNDYGASTIGFYGSYADQNGSDLTFIPANVVTFPGTGITPPRIIEDANDTLVATKYYTLQGIEVRNPATTGIYIVQKIFASGKTKATKIFVQIR